MKSPVLTILLVILAFPVYLFAHSPDSITLSHEKDEDREFLKITVSHDVRNVERHYVESITITVNDEELEELTFSYQETDEFHSIEYEVSGLNPGDVVKIEASCSRIGSASEEFTIE